MKKLLLASVASAVVAIGSASAAPLTPSAFTPSGGSITFSTSRGTQPGNVGSVTLTQMGDSVKVLVDLLSPTYGFLNMAGAHTPFAFTLANENAVTAVFGQPSGGIYRFGKFSFDRAGRYPNSPYGSYGVGIRSTARKGRAWAYYGDLEFTVSSTLLGGHVDINDFVANNLGYYFSADLTNHQNAGVQAWSTPGAYVSPPDIVPLPPPHQVPEPMSFLLLGVGLLGLVGGRCICR